MNTVLHSQTNSAFIYITKMQPLQFSNHTKWDFGFILMHHAALCYIILSTGSFQPGLLIANKTLTFTVSLNAPSENYPQQTGWIQQEWLTGPACAAVCSDHRWPWAWGCVGSDIGRPTMQRCSRWAAHTLGQMRATPEGIQQLNTALLHKLTHTATNAECLWILTQWLLHNHLH